MPTAGEGRAQARTGHCVSGQRTGDLDGVGDTHPRSLPKNNLTLTHWAVLRGEAGPSGRACPWGGWSNRLIGTTRMLQAEPWPRCHSRNLSRPPSKPCSVCSGSFSSRLQEWDFTQSRESGI